MSSTTPTAPPGRYTSEPISNSLPLDGSFSHLSLNSSLSELTFSPSRRNKAKVSASLALLHASSPSIVFNTSELPTSLNNKEASSSPQHASFLTTTTNKHSYDTNSSCTYSPTDKKHLVTPSSSSSSTVRNNHPWILVTILLSFMILRTVPRGLVSQHNGWNPFHDREAATILPKEEWILQSTSTFVETTQETSSSSLSSSASTTMSHPSSSPSSNAALHPLPSNLDNGVVLFFHLPKAGGVSMRQMVKQSTQLQYTSNDKRRSSDWMERQKHEITKWVSQPPLPNATETVRFAEFHWDLESIVSMDSNLTQWRQLARQNNVPFFVFMSVRQPLDYFLSFFNFMCIFLHRHKSATCPPPWNVDTMLKRVPDNPQTRWICYATQMPGLKEHDFDVSVPVRDCQGAVFDILKRNFDWIGDTKKLDETMQVFAGMGIQLQYQHSNSTPKRPKMIYKEDVNGTAMELIEAQTTIDSQLYEWATSRYTLEALGIERRTTSAQNNDSSLD